MANCIGHGSLELIALHGLTGLTAVRQTCMALPILSASLPL